MVLDGGDGGWFWKGNRFFWWVEVLWGQGGKRGWIFLASPRVCDDRELGRKIVGFSSGRRFHIEKCACLRGVG